jgi:hypothetical protein
VDHHAFESFLRLDVHPFITDKSFTILDNASVHTTSNTKRVLDEVCGGRWKTVPPYSPDLSPIEIGFANVWRYVRKHHSSAMGGTDAAIRLINRAFLEYSCVRGYKGHVAKEHFSMYQRRYDLFNKQMMLNAKRDAGL